MRRTKIVCTVGPASEDLEMLKEFIQLGMDVARINLSHGTPGTRKGSKGFRSQPQMNKRVGIMIDTSNGG